jgi:hypothetical protein
MELNLIQEWDAKAAAAIRTGFISQVEDLCIKDPPTESVHFNLLLEYTEAATDLSPSTKTEIRNVIFENLSAWIPASKMYHDPEFAAVLREMIPSGRRISVLEIFRLSMTRHLPVKGDPSKVTLEIWNCLSAYLWNHGALWACAMYGATQLLEVVLTTIRDELPEEERLRRAINEQGPHSRYTALGVAILNGHLECIDSIGSFLPPSSTHLFEDAGSCADLGMHVLRFAIHIASLWAGFTEDEEHMSAPSQTANRTAPLTLDQAIDRGVATIETIIDIWPQTLCKHDENGYPPYHHAKEFSKRFGGRDDIELLIRRCIFEKLEDYDLVSQALYGPDGEFFEEQFSADYDADCLKTKVSL